MLYGHYDVASRVIAELGQRADGWALKCFRTAAELTHFSRGDDEFPFAESAAYNVREALDSVVRDRPAMRSRMRART